MNTRFLLAVMLLSALASGVFFGSRDAVLNSEFLAEDDLQSKMQTATLLPDDLKVIPEVDLIDHKGGPITADSFRGQWQLLFFGYTRCPDICPMTLAVANRITDKISEAKDSNSSIRTVFVTVDPERDTPEHLDSYLSFFNPTFVGVSGKIEEIQKLSRSLGIISQYEENPSRVGHYLVDHTAALLLINPKGAVTAMFSSPHISDQIVADIELIQSAYADS